MEKIKVAAIVVVLILLAGCVATALAYPFLGRDKPA